MSETGETALEHALAVNNKLGHAVLSRGELYQDGMSDDIERHLSLDRVADLTSYSVYRLREFIKTGELKAVRWGRAYRVPESEVRRFMKARENAEIPEPQRPGAKTRRRREDEDQD